MLRLERAVPPVGESEVRSPSRDAVGRADRGTVWTKAPGPAHVADHSSNGRSPRSATRTARVPARALACQGSPDAIMAAPAPARVATAYPHHRGAGESLRAGIWRMFEDPSSSPAAKVVALLTVLAIVLSTVAYVVQTLPAYVYSPDPAWDALERTMITLFTLELAIRLACCPNYRAFFSSPLNWIDVAAVVPFYVELALVADSAAAAGNSGALRVLRLARIFRVFRVSRYLPWMRVFVRALLLSLQPLLMLVFVVLIGVVVFASAIYYAERGEWDATLAGGTWVRRGADGSATESPFRSIPDSMWWAIVVSARGGLVRAVGRGEREGQLAKAPCFRQRRRVSGKGTVFQAAALCARAVRGAVSVHCSWRPLSGSRAASRRAGLEAWMFARDPLPYHSLFQTMTTVGYGDAVPLTPSGRFVASLAALSGAWGKPKRASPHAHAWTHAVCGHTRAHAHARSASARTCTPPLPPLLSRHPCCGHSHHGHLHQFQQ